MLLLYSILKRRMEVSNPYSTTRGLMLSLSKTPSPYYALTLLLKEHKTKPSFLSLISVMVIKMFATQKHQKIYLPLKQHKDFTPQK
jgi:hypothetical protein